MFYPKFPVYPFGPFPRSHARRDGILAVGLWEGVDAGVLLMALYLSHLAGLLAGHDMDLVMRDLIYPSPE